MVQSLRFASLSGVLVVGAVGALFGCSSAAPVLAQAPKPAASVAPAPPPKDDGAAAKGGEGGDTHASALEELKVGKLIGRIDRQRAVSVPLPDGANWTRVKFWGVPTLVGFRYGKGHHAIVAGVITHVDDNHAPGACVASMQDVAQPLIDSFEVDLERFPPHASTWRDGVADILSLDAKTATIVDHDLYSVGFGTYPAWPGACLIVGVAVPSRGDIERAHAVRDRFVAEVLPKVQVLAKEEPQERY